MFDRQTNKQAYCAPNKIGGSHREASKTPKYFGIHAVVNGGLELSYKTAENYSSTGEVKRIAKKTLKGENHN